MEHELLTIKNNAISLIFDAKDKKELEEIKLQFLGRSGELTKTLKGLTKLSADEKPAIGRVANEVKDIIENAISQKESEIIKAKPAKINIDITEPGIMPNVGHLHPMSITLFELVDIFKKIGFQAADGPDI